MTTIAAFVAGVAGMSVTGVTRQFAYEPSGVENADLPATFPKLPNAAQNTATLSSCDNSGQSRTVDLVLLVSPTNQELSATLWANVITMADNLETAIKALTTMPLISWSLTTGAVILDDDVEYAAVVATITGTE